MNFFTLRPRGKIWGKQRKTKMKKVMIAAAVAAVAGIAGAIESANTVGYNTVTINKEYTILGIPSRARPVPRCPFRMPSPTARV